MLKLHLGCGVRHFPGFVHVDLSELDHVEHQHRFDALPFLADACAELIYCSHGLSYLDDDEAEAALREWRRVLAPGGVLRLAVPDFAALTELYRRTGQIAHVLGPLYGRIELQTAQGPLTLFHRTGYDAPRLTQRLLDCGFADVRPWDWRTTCHAQFDDHSQAFFPHMDKASGLHLSLNLEARKPHHV
jgi:ubiquinone/menaquinone biosynthesis C-methylase UbiE